jgi:uncharacterized protein YaaW (UPF0174 family)
MAEEITQVQDKARTTDIAKGALRWFKARSKSSGASKVLKGMGSDSLPPDRLELREPCPSRALGRTITIPSSGSSPADALVPSGSGPLSLIEDDEDLVPLLRQASNEELGPLVEYIIGKGGVTAQLQRTQRYRQYSLSRDHSKYADDIAAEIQKFGANTFWTHTIRKGRGIKYRKILRQVAKRCGVMAGLGGETAELEERVLAAVLSRAYEGMTIEKRLELLDTLKIHQLPGAGGPIAAGALQAAIQAAGFAPYKLAVIVANGTANAILGHGLAFAANAGLTKAVALFAGPAGWALDAVWGGMIAAGPAYRVTLPCVVQVAMIRQSMLRKQREEKLKKLRVAGMVALIALVCILAVLVARHFMR